MANKHMERCSTSYTIRELQKKKKNKNKTSRYHDMPFRMVSIQRTTSNAGKDVNQQELSFLGGGDAKW